MNEWVKCYAIQCPLCCEEVLCELQANMQGQLMLACPECGAAAEVTLEWFEDGLEAENE